MMNRRNGNISIILASVVMVGFIAANIISDKVKHTSSKTEVVTEENIDSTTSHEKTEDKTSTSENKKDNIGVATIDGVSVRDKNSSNGTYLGSLYTGDEVEIIEEMSNGWYKIKYKNKDAYVSNTFIRKNGVDYTPEAVINSGKVTASKLGVRTEESKSSTIIGTYIKGETVQIVDDSSKDWYRIQYDSQYGYVEKKYIQINSDETPEAPKNRTNLNNFLFIGDSYTYRLGETIRSKNNNKVFIQAQSGSRPSYWLDKVDAMPSNNSVEGVTMLIGVNGVANTEQNIKDTKELINKLVKRYPNKKIYVQKVFPVGSGFTEGDAAAHNKKIDKFNKEIEAFCKNKSNVVIIDAREGLVDSKGYLNPSDDGLHIDMSNNSVFYGNIFEAIKKAEKSK